MVIRSWAVGVGLSLSLGCAGAGCIVEVEDDDEPVASCGGLMCSVDASCYDGACVCDSGFVGDPYAAYGCQPLPGERCATTCGLNAYCAPSGECLCAQGFVAVCGTGDCLAQARLCDGVEDCLNGGDEDPSQCSRELEQTWSVVDGCNDGWAVQWRLWSSDGQWVWPSEQETFRTPAYGEVDTETIVCLDDEWICLGAASGDLAWGVGVDGTGTCEDCCFPCTDDAVDFGWLDCD